MHLPVPMPSHEQHLGAQAYAGGVRAHHLQLGSQADTQIPQPAPSRLRCPYALSRLFRGRVAATDAFRTMPALNANQKLHSVIFFFFYATILWSTWLSVRAGLSEPVWGPPPPSSTPSPPARCGHSQPGSAGSAPRGPQSPRLAAALRCLQPERARRLQLAGFHGPGALPGGSSV